MLTCNGMNIITVTLRASLISVPAGNGQAGRAPDSAPQRHEFAFGEAQFLLLLEKFGAIAFIACVDSQNTASTVVLVLMNKTYSYVRILSYTVVQSHTHEYEYVRIV